MPTPTHTMRFRQTILACLAASALAAPALHAQTKDKQGTTARGSTERSTTPAPQNTLNAVAEAARGAGAKRCVDRLDQFSKFVTQNNSSGAVLFFPNNQKDIDPYPLSASFEILGKESSAYTSITASPRWNGCSGMYEAIVFWPASCETVAMKQFAGMKPVGAIKQNITILGETTNLRVFLMPAGQNCVSIKKEVVY